MRKCYFASHAHKLNYTRTGSWDRRHSPWLHRRLAATLSSPFLLLSLCHVPVRGDPLRLALKIGLYIMEDTLIHKNLACGSGVPEMTPNEIVMAVLCASCIFVPFEVAIVKLHLVTTTVPADCFHCGFERVTLILASSLGIFQMRTSRLVSLPHAMDHHHNFFLL